MQCRAHAAQLGRLYDEFKAANGQVLVILGDTHERARQYAQNLHLPFPVLSDADRGVYHRYGLEKAYVFIQRTASVIVDKSGVIRYFKAATNPMTWLGESKDLLQSLQAIAASERPAGTDHHEPAEHAVSTIASGRSGK